MPYVHVDNVGCGESAVGVGRGRVRKGEVPVMMYIALSNSSLSWMVYVCFHTRGNLKHRCKCNIQRNYDYRKHE